MFRTAVRRKPHGECVAERLPVGTPPLKMGEFQFCRGRRNAWGKPITDVAIQTIKCQITGPRMTKGDAERFQRRIEPPDGTPLIGGVIVTDHLDQVSKGVFAMLLLYRASANNWRTIR